MDTAMWHMCHMCVGVHIAHASHCMSIISGASHMLRAQCAPRPITMPQSQMTAQLCHLFAHVMQCNAMQCLKL
eukprot:3168749-Prorocentrum_lima.AAC.1